MAGRPLRVKAPARPAVWTRPRLAEVLLPAEPASLSGAVFVQCRGENVLAHVLGTRMVEPLIEHQPLDDPAAQAERVEPLGRVPVERLRVGDRVERRRWG